MNKLFTWFCALLVLAPILTIVSAHASVCSSPAGKEADVIYNLSFHTYQFCNGTNWKPYSFGYAWQQQSTYTPTPPAGSGFFVMSGTQWNANLGGRSGGDSKCYTELTSTYTGWRGYSTANANGLLVPAHIHALLCDSTTCSNLKASTTYNFAVADNAVAGGATFTTDSSGNGPSDSADWAASNYFGNYYNYWSNMGNTGSSTKWTGTPYFPGNPNAVCTNFTVNTSGLSAIYGSSSNIDYHRWVITSIACNKTLNLICFVDP